jgi:hypothetical protein
MAAKVKRTRCKQGTTASGHEITGCSEMVPVESLIEGLCPTCRTLVQVTDTNTGETYLVRPDTKWSREMKAEHGVI